MNKYEQIETKDIEELETKAVLYRHKKSGARILTLKNADDNKVFSIAFRTPAEDSTGVAHITEHSVLCGSERFPLKDPFVELAKGSLNTFLNAMTYPDKTVYPVASTNDRDFDNLMNVYLDAVFFPNSRKDERILRQEGWHYELESPEAELTLNGVVYNEMKGAFSNPESVLERYILHALYPDTSYGNESGGDPEEIPSLSYEAFCRFHDRYYHPSNSYIVLYGDLDMEKKLEWLDREYLSRFDVILPDSGILRQEPFGKPRHEEITYAVGEHESLKKKTYLSYNVSVGDNLDARMGMAFSVLDYALLSAPGAPLKQALTDAGIGEDIFGGYEDGILQPYFSVIAKNAEAKDEKRFLKIIRENLERLAREGLDRKTLLAAINHDEFQYREADYGRTPKGLIYALTALDSWIYDSTPWEHLVIQEHFRELREAVETGYFEELIRKYLLDSSFAAVVVVKPERGLTERKEQQLRESLQQKLAALSAAEKQRLVEETKALKLYQDTPTREEDLEKLPLLRREDISEKAESYPWEEKKVSGMTMLSSRESTRGIAYVRLNFNTGCLTAEELPYAGLLRSLLLYMDTRNHRYQELSSDILLNTGGISLSVTAYPKLQEYNRYVGIFSVDMKLLYEQLEYGLRIADEVLHTTKFDDEKRMIEILEEARSRERMRVEGSAHTYAVNRATAGFSGTAAYAESTSGVDFYRFIEQAEEEYRRDPERFVSRLWDVTEKLFNKDNLFVSVTAEQAGLDALEALLPAFSESFARNDREQNLLRDILNQREERAEKTQETPQLLLRGAEKEAFGMPSQVNYVARTGRFDTEKLPYTGALRVLKILLNYEYLWLNLRVKGGAYGCMSGFGRTGEGYLVSYRDPHIAETLEIYEKLPEYIRTFRCSDRDLTKYVIGAISELDTPKTSSTRSHMTVSAFLSGVTGEMLQRERKEVLSVTLEDIQALAPYLEAILGQEAGCTIGGSRQVKAAEDCFDETSELFHA